MTVPSWLYWLETCPSTNTWALEHLDKFQNGDGVFTERQTAGRGQQGRTWQAPPGVLTASFVLDSSGTSTGFSLAAGLAVIYTLEDLLPDLKLQLKWPNDIWLQQRKLAGILCEERSGRLVVGVGLNCSVNFSETERVQLGDPISLHQVVDRVPETLQLLTAIRSYLRQAISVYAHSESVRPLTGLTRLLPQLNQRHALQGQWVEVQLPQEQVAGDVVGIDASGCLLLKLADRTIRPIVSGHVITQNFHLQSCGRTDSTPIQARIESDVARLDV